MRVVHLARIEASSFLLLVQRLPYKLRSLFNVGGPWLRKEKHPVQSRGGLGCLFLTRSRR